MQDEVIAAVERERKAPRHIVLRRASMDDVPRILDGIEGYFEECALEGYPPVNMDDARQVLSESVENSLCIVADCDGKVAGSFGFRLVPWLWNSKKSFLLGDWLYVRKEFREGGTGARLIKAACEIADLNRVVFIFSLHSKFEKDLIGRVLMFHGFTHVGGNFMYIPKKQSLQ